jgi:hypothetical protein
MKDSLVGLQSREPCEPGAATLHPDAQRLLQASVALQGSGYTGGETPTGSINAIWPATPAERRQTKMLVTCQRFDDLFLFGLIWQYSSSHKTYNKGRFKVIATYLQQ